MSSMKIYLIQRNDDKPMYDVYDGFVVAASSRKEARGLCAESAADEGEDTWLLSKKSSAREVATEASYKVPRIILSDFNAG